jgi:hypothetical protein
VYRLDFNLHQLILTELAQNISDSIDAGDPVEEVNEAIELITSKVVTRDITGPQSNGEEPKVFMAGLHLTLTLTRNSSSVIP